MGLIEVPAKTRPCRSRKCRGRRSAQLAALPIRIGSCAPAKAGSSPARPRWRLAQPSRGLYSRWSIGRTPETTRRGSWRSGADESGDRKLERPLKDLILW